MTERLPRRFALGSAALFVPPLAAAVLLGATLRHRSWNEPFFVYSAYYVLFALLAIHLGVRLSDAGNIALAGGWVREHIRGIVVTAAISTVVVLAVDPAFRVLADEANLVGVSKNLFFQRTANFAVTGKWYFDNYWNIEEVTDRRPALFPFFVALMHTVRGYHAENAFHVNAIVFVLFVFASYRLAKSLGGEVFGVAAAIAVAVNPNVLVAARSAGFDFISTFLILTVVRSFLDYARNRTPVNLARLTLNLCFLANVRYESWALIAVVAAILFAFRLVRRADMRGYGFVYSLVPLFLLPRYWQSIAKAADAEQPLSASLFGVSSFRHNLGDYLRPALHPLEIDGPHSPLLMILAAGGCVLLLFRIARGVQAKTLAPDRVQVAVLIVALLGLEGVICFSYNWGKPQHAASARLFLWLDTFVSFAAAWLLTVVGTRVAALRAPASIRSGAVVTWLACAVLFAMHIPAASEARFINALLLTRQAAETWRFFDRLGQKRILILSDRPGLFTIMNYGAVDISTADSAGLLFELSRHLYADIYLVQEVDLANGRPRPAFAVWPDVGKETVYEFQNTDADAVRIARVKR
jgi:hypothetical protein